MSRKSNVNPDHYKLAGRDRPDDAARARRRTAPTAKARRRTGAPAPRNTMPGARPAGGRSARTRGDDRR